MRIDLLTREFPPEVYGGAGVHVAELTPALRDLGAEVRVRCVGAPRNVPGVRAYPLDPGLAAADTALGFLATDAAMAADCAGADLVHSHTWYANTAGHLAALLHGVPHVMTTHSLEPLRPWKAEQLGGGYALSSWMERVAAESADAVVAVSEAMRADVLAAYPAIDPDRVHTVHNGIDTTAWTPHPGVDALLRHGVAPDRPYVLFVGRLTRQKGLPHLLRAAYALPPGVQLVLCCGRPDTPDLAAEVDALVADLATRRSGVRHVPGMLDRAELRQLLTHAAAFVCPSLYEPMGIVNLEAMACGTPVVATAVGGIPEVVTEDTGLLVPYEAREDGTGEPADPDALAAGLAAALTRLLDDPGLGERLGKGGRDRAETEFSWTRAAERTLAVHRSVLQHR
jgi:starch synthase